MSAPAEVLPSPSAARSAAAAGRAAVDRLLSVAADRLNPILVKETRQALKSKQFLITFMLLLIVAWVWTIGAVAYIGPDIYYSAQGRDLFAGYYIILSFPLVVIVPFGAFRSLAVEQEDRTYELLSITTLNPRQIVSGKLGSAFLQMLIYLSAITPCLGFTYMLRGIDFPTILFILYYTVLGSLALSLVGLLLGTLTTARHWQVVLSVVLIAGLLFALIWAIGLTMALLSEGTLPFSTVEFWQINAGILTAYVTYFLLLFYAAAAQITFASDNRSTRLRIVMLAQQLLWTGWMTWVWIGPAEGEPSVLPFFTTVLALHWFFLGALMTGESPELSLRVRRQLPQSFLGRVFFTWFNPGPGTGYVFAVAGLLGGALMVAVGLAVWESADWWHSPRGPSSRPASSTTLAFAFLAPCYLAIYLGVGLLLIRLLRKVLPLGNALSLLLQVLLVILGTFVPLIIHWVSPWRESGYWLLHLPDPFWTLAHVVDSSSSLPADAPLLLVLLPAGALLVFVMNLSAIAREVRHVRIARPQRVEEEDAALRALKHPPQPVRLSPWD